MGRARFARYAKFICRNCIPFCFLVVLGRKAGREHVSTEATPVPYSLDLRLDSRES